MFRTHYMRLFGFTCPTNCIHQTTFTTFECVWIDISDQLLMFRTASPKCTLIRVFFQLTSDTITT